MPTQTDWLPFNHDELLNKATQTTGYLLSDSVRTRIGLGNATPMGNWYDTEFIPKFSAFKAAHAEWKDPATRCSLFVVQLQSAEKTFKATYRQLYTGFLKSNPLVTSVDLISMGLPERNGGRSPVPLPFGYPEGVAIASSPAVVQIRYREAGNAHFRKPAGVHGAEMRWEMLDELPLNYDQLTHSVFNTRSPIRLTFRGEDRGKRIYFAFRWENTRGEKGKWGNISSTIVP